METSVKKEITELYKRMMDINSLMFNHVQLLVDVETEEVLYSTVNRMFNYLFEENNKAGGGFFNIKSSIDNKDLVWLKAAVGSWTHFLEVQDGNASEYCFITVFPIKRKHIIIHTHEIRMCGGKNLLMQPEVSHERWHSTLSMLEQTRIQALPIFS